MDNTIILSFNFNTEQIFNTIFIYCNRFTDISKLDLNKSINKLIRNNIIININNYELTDEGKYMLNQLNIYYKRIIIAFYKKYKIKSDKKYALKEIRIEQQNLRNHLMSNYPNVCMFCDKKLPYFLLETAHIKPRCLLNYNDRKNYNNVIFLCRLCHVIFDKGFIAVFNSQLLVSDKLKILDYDLPKYKNCLDVKEKKIFFDFHYNFISILDKSLN
jgi:predicted restriction endonuclease